MQLLALKANCSTIPPKRHATEVEQAFQASAGCFGRPQPHTINMGGLVSNATIVNDINDMPVG
jgi:hypothetical protein